MRDPRLDIALATTATKGAMLLSEFVASAPSRHEVAMSEPIGNWIFTLAISAGLLPAPGANISSRSEPVLPMGAVCQSKFEKAAAGVFHGVGVVTEIDSGTGSLTLDHEDIIGLMPAMVMMYRVATPAISRALKVGDRIAFDLDGTTYAILGAKVISP